MKKINLSFLLFSIVFICSSCGGNSSGETVITVGDESVTSGEILFMMSQNAESVSDAEIIDISEDYLINYSLLSLEAQKEEITVSDSEVKSRMTGIFSDDELNKLKKAYGVSKDSVKRVVKKQIFGQKYMMNVLEKKKDFIPTEEQLLDMFYNSYYKIQHIFINTENMTSKQLEEARENTERILRRVRNSDNFEEYMLENPQNCGEYIIKEGEIEAELFEAVKLLQANEISEIVKSPTGYHIIKRIPLMNSDMAEKETELINEFKRQYVESLLEDLKTKYDVNINEAKLKEITVSAGF